MKTMLDVIADDLRPGVAAALDAAVTAIVERACVADHAADVGESGGWLTSLAARLRSSMLAWQEGALGPRLLAAPGALRGRGPATGPWSIARGMRLSITVELCGADRAELSVYGEASGPEVLAHAIGRRGEEVTLSAMVDARWPATGTISVRCGAGRVMMPYVVK